MALAFVLALLLPTPLLPPAPAWWQVATVWLVAFGLAVGVSRWRARRRASGPTDSSQGGA